MSCANIPENDDERVNIMQNLLDRNPTAFKGKIAKDESEGSTKHNKGCNCKKTNCMKKYCECY